MAALTAKSMANSYVIKFATVFGFLVVSAALITAAPNVKTAVTTAIKTIKTFGATFSALLVVGYFYQVNNTKRGPEKHFRTQW